MPLPSRRVRDVVTAVLDGERVADALVSVTFVSPGRMRALHRRTFGTDRLTDVIAFELPHRDAVVGDVYICPPVAERSARAMGISAREEVVRLLIHGSLHILGYEHPAGAHRTGSAMWRRQERYVRALASSARGKR